MNLNFENMNSQKDDKKINEAPKPPISAAESGQDLERLRALGFEKVVEELREAGIENPEEVAREILD